MSTRPGSITFLLLYVCIAKFEELDDNLPSIEALQSAAQIGFTFGTADFYKREEFHAMELYILKFFNWSISHPTAAHFIDYYIHISMQDIPSLVPNWERNALQNQLHDLCTHFLETALKGIHTHYHNSYAPIKHLCTKRILFFS